MTVLSSVPAGEEFERQLAAADPDMLRLMVKSFAEALMSAEADAACGAGYGQVSSERTNSRNGYRTRGWDTRVGSIELAIPKLRTGSYFPEWLLAQTSGGAGADERGGHRLPARGLHPPVERLAAELGVTQLSKSQVSAMATHLDEQVRAFRERPLDAGP
ncbi:transposase [Actinospica sp. MGRD01-02]|uniref:Mutator family transposase n=1 Tax=Actinospica acidithermotolerans TaxID=2828514 RepID=A0A941IPS1_9ACTN|nr:transposase [Actinospica acidithermotolerans]MBR7830711.1 transposase [Actinospica acidithermotolerans]